VDDGFESALGSRAEDDLRAANVRLLDLPVPPRVEGEHGGGVDDRLTALQRALHRLRLRDVAGACVDLSHAERLERWSDPLERPYEKTHLVPGLDQLRDCVRADKL
jgi:hypothetical protein